MGNLLLNTKSESSILNKYFLFLKSKSKIYHEYFNNCSISCCCIIFCIQIDKSLVLENYRITLNELMYSQTEKKGISTYSGTNLSEERSFEDIKKVSKSEDVPQK